MKIPFRFVWTASLCAVCFSTSPLSAPQVSAQEAPATAIEIPTDPTQRLREATLAYNAGLSAMNRNDWIVAAAQFGKATQLSPEDALSWSFLGYVRLQQKQWDDALKALGNAQDGAKDLDVRARAQLLNNIGFARWNKDQYPEARSAFEEALKLESDYFDARYNLAFAMLSRDDYNDAIPHLRILLQKQPNDAALLDGMGEALEKTGNIGGALGYYKRAVVAAPKNESYGLKFALALRAANRSEDAAEQLRAVLKANPNSAAALLQLGDIHLRANRYSEAAAALQRYVAMRGSDYTGRFNLGVALDSLGPAKSEEALAQYAEAEKLRPTDPGVKNNIGLVHYKRKNYEEAITRFNQALELDTNYHDARINLALALGAQDKFAEANAQWIKVVEEVAGEIRASKSAVERAELTERLVTAQTGLAGNYLAQKKWREAGEEYRRLVARDAKNLDARLGLARALYNQKDFAGAESALREVVTREPKNASAYNDLGVVLEARNDRKGALEAYERALQIQPDHAEAKSNLARLQAAATVS